MSLVAGLTAQYLSLLIALQERPLATIEELATRIGVSKPTALRRLRLLSGEEGGKRYFTVNPLLNNHNLGLEATDVLLEATGPEATTVLERVARVHPYTAYRCRCYGAFNGVFLQFRVPLGTSSQVRGLVRLLQQAGVVERAQFVVANEPTIYTSLKIDGWDPESMRWDFDWANWFQTDVMAPPQESPTGDSGVALEWLTQRDLEILYELMKNARRKNVEIIDALRRRGVDITPTTFSRRLRMLREECIEGYRVAFDPEAFDIYSNIIVVGRGDPDELLDLWSRLQARPIPFESTMRVSGDELFWFVRLQPSHLSPLLSSLYSLLTEMSVFLMDYTHSYIFYIWSQTLDEENHRWRTDREFMVEDVLTQALQ